MLVVALLAVMLSPLAAGAVRREAAPAAVAPQVVVVRDGDTLWSIASRIRPGVDPRETVVAISAANGVDAGELVAGQTLVVPSG